MTADSGVRGVAVFTEPAGASVCCLPNIGHKVCWDFVGEEIGCMLMVTVEPYYIRAGKTLRCSEDN